MTNNKFFYIEDDDILASVTVKALIKRSYEVEHFSSVAEASACDHLSDFAYGLLDLKLEDGNSLALIDALINANPRMKILVLTGYASIASAVQAVKMGATNYLAKPATVDDILRAFEKGAGDSRELSLETVDEMSLRRREWETIQTALAANNGNISATARHLKMHRRTLQRKLQKKPVSE
ncbi:response regulator transcription factor [Teredinibacter haidensis]|uniref:response regulator transcription factor n=1 Tax=Teredinibacter haidensis TaxID=2731755 RepID=UPI0009489A3E|nr:response regulator [Teredinibacter haidensis]